MNILKIKDPQGNWVNIPALKGDKGDKGDPGISPTIDSTLSQTNQAADAKAVGDKIDEITLTIDETLTQSGQVADAKVTGDALNTKADQNGYYENLNVGVADQLASKNYIEDNEAYTFRPTANGVKVGTREFDTIVGGSVVWNQLVNDSDSSVTVTNGHKYIAKVGGAYSVAVSDGTAVAVTGGTDEIFDLTQMLGSTIADYIYSLEQATAGAGVTWFRKYFLNDYYDYNPGELMHVSDLQNHDTVGFNQWDEEWEIGSYNSDGVPTSDPTRIRTKNPIRVFGGMTYYVKAPTTLGIRFYDANDSFISSGYLKIMSNQSVTAPVDACYLRFSVVNRTVYNNDICINLSWSGTRDGKYEPYVKHSYPLDSTLTMRGIPKLVDGKLTFDGDIYKPDGTVERRYGIVDLGTLTWIYNSTANAFVTEGLKSSIKPTASDNEIPKFIQNKYNQLPRSQITLGTSDKVICENITGSIVVSDLSYTNAEILKAALSGVYLVYELAEPTTETAQPYQSPQIIDPYGTEEYITTSIVPVGHKTQYPEDLRAKIESLPWDFANLIAPVETTYKATQNYTTGSLFIVDNILYKATANIANGGTITPNTNCIPTTLAEIIAAL